MSLFKAKVPPSRVPTLTEVVEVNDDLAEEVTGPAYCATEVAAAHSGTPSPTVLASEPVNTDLLTQQVMADIQRQINAMLEVRLKEALAPVVARLTDALARDARAELAKVMKEVVSRAVSDEMRRTQTKP